MFEMYTFVQSYNVRIHLAISVSELQNCPFEKAFSHAVVVQVVVVTGGEMNLPRGAEHPPSRFVSHLEQVSNTWCRRPWIPTALPNPTPWDVKMEKIEAAHVQIIQSLFHVEFLGKRTRESKSEKTRRMRT